MNKKVLIIIITVVFVLLVGIGIFMVIGNKSGKDNGGTTGINMTNKESAIMSDEFQFILDMDKISEEWWNSINESMKEFNYTNNKVYNTKKEGTLGSSSGKLQVCPAGFTESIKIGNEYYSLNVASNNFLTPEQIKIINTDVKNISSKMKFYVLGNDLNFYNVNLSIDKKTSDVELDDGNWKTVSNEKDGKFYLNSYYPINSNYCLHIEFPTTIAEESWNDMNEATKNHYKSNFPYDEKDLEELAESVTSLVSLKKINDSNTTDKLTINVELDDIKLDNNTTVLMNTMKMISWHSGAEDVASSKLSRGDTVIIAYNTNGGKTTLTEYNASKNMDDYFSITNIELKEYNYEGKDIYISYYTDKATTKTFRGKYRGIMFKIDDIWYEISGTELIDPTQTDVNEWIKNLCDGVISL